MASSPRLVIDDRLLVEEILVGLEVEGDRHTTSTWYFRACRAAVLGAGGHLSGPFVGLGAEFQQDAIQALLTLPESVGLPDPRSTVPLMADLARRHPRLNVLNLEATALALDRTAEVLLSPEGAAGILPAVLDAEGIPWRRVEI